MSKDVRSEISTSSEANGIEDTNANIEEINRRLNELYMQLTEAESTSKPVFQQLLHQFKTLQESEADPQRRCHRRISLYSELIDTAAEATSADGDDFQSCLRLAYNIIPDFKSAIRTEHNKLFAREILFALLNLLSRSEIRSYLEDHRQTETSSRKFYENLTNVLLTIAASTIRNVYFTDEDIRAHKYAKTFSAMYKRVDHDVQRNTRIRVRSSDDNQTTSCILSFFWNLSDRTIIVPWLLGIGLVGVMLQCLRVTTLPLESVRQLINIIHNISRHDDGADELNKLDGLRLLKSAQSDIDQRIGGFSNLVVSMAIAQLSTTEQIRSDNRRMNKILNQLLEMTMDAAKADDHRNEHRFHVSEFLAVLTKLFVDDRSLEYVLNHAETDPQLSDSSTIALFVELLIKFRDSVGADDHLSQFTCTALLNILWSISFQDRYKSKLQHNDQFLKVIRSLAVDTSEKRIDQYVPRSMESMANAINGILYNLNETADDKKLPSAARQLDSSADRTKPTIMISYAHDNNEFCDKILMELEKHKYRYGIWIDRDHCASTEDLWEKIARGIGQSKLVVCLLSPEYFNSKSCRKEATFAIKRKKPIVPVYLGEPGDCDWLDIHIAGLKYVRFKDHTAELSRAKVQEMLQTIEATMNEAQELLPVPHEEQHSIPQRPRKEVEGIKSTVAETNKAPEEWTRDDIQKWFSSRNVPDALVELFDFQSLEELRQYAAKLQANPQKEYSKYERRYAKAHKQEELEEHIFDRFRNALLTLPDNQSWVMKPPATKSIACTVL